MPRFIEPVTLRGEHVSVEPLAREHVAALRDAANDGELWRLWYTSVPSPEGVEAYVETALSWRDGRDAMPFVVRENASGHVVGCTRFCNVEPAHRRLELGYTWYAKRVQRSPVNTECKLLLLGHAFEALQCIAVELRTNWFNFASRAAIARLGARQDGVLRNHQITPDGLYRDTVVFSILDSEWLPVKRNLRYMLDRPR
jgi:N-acetyltransferase